MVYDVLEFVAEPRLNFGVVVSVVLFVRGMPDNDWVRYPSGVALEKSGLSDPSSQSHIRGRYDVWCRTLLVEDKSL